MLLVLGRGRKGRRGDRPDNVVEFHDPHSSSLNRVIVKPGSLTIPPKCWSRSPDCVVES